jgi:hypothetical protein
MYSYWDMVVPKYNSLRSNTAMRALGVETTLLKRSVDVLIPAVGVMIRPG